MICYSAISYEKSEIRAPVEVAGQASVMNELPGFIN